MLAPAWTHCFCPYDYICFASVTAIVHYDNTIFTATRLVQGHASRNDSWYAACSNHVMNLHGQITIQSYSRIKWNSGHYCVGRGPLAFLPTVASQSSPVNTEVRFPIVNMRIWRWNVSFKIYICPCYSGLFFAVDNIIPPCIDLLMPVPVAARSKA